MKLWAEVIHLVKERRPSPHSLTPHSTYIRSSEEFEVGNYDPYRKAITEEPSPEEVTRTGSTWTTFWPLLFGAPQH